MNLKMKFDYFMPTELKFGNGSLQRVANILEGFGSHGFIVTGQKSMERLGFTEILTSQLAQVHIKSTVYNKISSNPSIGEVDLGADLSKEVGADFIIAMGGGSVIDAAKAIAAASAGAIPVSDYLFNNTQVPINALPLIAIPTTAGTGSEMNRSAIIRDPVKELKVGLRSDHLFPKITIVDPELTYSLPNHVTAETGFDTLTHAIESYVSPKSQPITDLFSLMAIENISTHLPIVLSDPVNAESREKISLSSAMMGNNLSFVGTCFPHRVDKPLCALYPDISHGQSLAVFYTYWAKMSWKGNKNRFADISSRIDRSTMNYTLLERAERFPETISNFIKSIGLKTNILELGVSQDIIPKLVKGVEGDLSINPVPVTREQLPGIIQNVFQTK